MADHIVTFDVAEAPVTVPTGTLLSEAAHLAGVEIQQPCGGQGRCGRCAVQVIDGSVRRRSTLRLSADDMAAGYALACQTVVEGDVKVAVPPQEKIERRLTTDRTAVAISVPEGYDADRVQTIRRLALTLPPPTIDDQTDDWGRLQRALRQHARIAEVGISLPLMRRIGSVMREGEWNVTAILDAEAWDCPNCPVRLIDLLPGHVAADAPLWGPRSHAAKT